MAISESDVRDSHDRVHMWISSLRGEMVDIKERDLASNKKIRELEGNLGDANERYSQLQMQYQELLATNERLKANPRHNIEPAHRIVVLIDGDGALFNFELIEQGQAGGNAAAAKIMESINEYENVGRRDEVWVYVFLNKRGLKTVLQRHNKILAAEQLEDFMIGMNQAAKTIIVVDVGSKKEAADSKMKVLLESEVHSVETRRVFFAGSHDNGYVNELRNQVTSGHKDKLVLVPSYTEVASGYRDLGLAMLNIEDLFMPEKLPYSPATIASPMSRTTFSSPERPEPGSERAGPQLGKASEATPVSSVASAVAEMWNTVGRSYARVPQHERNASFGDDDAASTTSSTAPTSPMVQRKSKKRINPDLPLSKQKPPPCTLFYLADACKREVDCKYGHNYDLEYEHYEEMRLNAKKTPCQAVNTGFVCTWGDNCCYGHKCPFAPNCHFFKLGNCKFKLKDMHKVSK